MHKEISYLGTNYQESSLSRVRDDRKRGGGIQSKLSWMGIRVAVGEYLVYQNVISWVERPKTFGFVIRVQSFRRVSEVNQWYCKSSEELS